MEIIIYSIGFITIVYLINILWLILGFSKVTPFQISAQEAKTKFTIIVPFRDEAENLPKLLDSISLLDYPRDQFEVILVDDDSADGFRILSFEFRVSIIDTIRVSNSPKKDAINTAISKANFDWIITTDADCIVPEQWLQAFDVFIQKNKPKMIASGVFYKTANHFLDHFQQLEMMGLQGTTIGSFGNRNAFMCNGANFCYQKDFFNALNGFEGNQNIASGDDVFLLQKGIQKSPDNVHFLKATKAFVITKTAASWMDLLQQRVRWASKTSNYNSFYAKQLALSVFLMNASLLFLFFWLWINLKLIILIFLLKILIDCLLLVKTSTFFKVKLKHIVLGSLCYPLFCVIVAGYSFFGNYSWKGRTFRK
jgi:glycosyltransferase involved in cell wall biosynthesis